MRRSPFTFWSLWHELQWNNGRLQEDVFIWETTEGQIVVVLNPELYVFAEQHDDMRQDILKRRGYTLSDFWEYHHHQPLLAPVTEVMLPEGYGVRALGDVDELPAPSFLSWKAIHPEEPLDRYGGWEWSLNIQHAPFYRRDLDLIAISPDGEFASFCTIWLTRCGAFEPAGTAPEHQRRGLGKTVISEGLCRLKDLGAEMAFIGSGSAEAYAFYTSVGFTEWDKSEIWERDL